MILAHVFDNAYTEEQRARIVAWVYRLRAAGLLEANTFGSGRFHRDVNALPAAEVEPAFLEIRDALVERFELARFPVDPFYGHLVSFHEPGAFVHTHLDPIEHEDWRHIRANLIIQHPTSGGTPVLGGGAVRIRPGQGWLFRPYKIEHASLPVGGELPRINLSFGWSVPKEYCLPGEAARCY